MMPPTLAGGLSRPPLETAQGSSGASTPRWRFSPRERQIVTLLADGCSNQEIANRLGLRLQTVKNHLRAIFEKLNVGDRLELALYAIHNLLE